MLQSLFRSLTLSLCWAITIVPATVAQESGNPLTNQDVIDLVRSGLEDSIVGAAIQANPTNFDVSAAALIKLKNDGISQKIMDTMLAAESSKRSSLIAPSVPASTAAIAFATSGTNGGNNPFSASSEALPLVTLVQGNPRRSLTPEKGQLAGTKRRLHH